MSDYFSAPVFVLGLPRSGTSMIAGALRICGAWTGETVPGGMENPRGFFEHMVIRENIVKQVLWKLGCDPLGVQKLPPVGRLPAFSGLDRAIRDIIEHDGYRHDRPWLYKDAKLSLIWPVFKPVFPGATWVIVRRDTESIINSCLGTSFMKQHSGKRDFWMQFVDNYQLRIRALQESGAECVEIWAPDLVMGSLGSLQNLVMRLGLDFREAAVKRFISPDFWHTTDRSAPVHVPVSEV